MKLVSWNVNGLRSCLTKGFLEYVKNEDPDILCLQETKLQPEQAVFDLEGYHRYFHSADKKGYSGTAVLTKEEPLSVTYGFGADIHRHEGRVITAEYPDFYLVCCYTPNSQDGLKRGLYSRKARRRQAKPNEMSRCTCRFGVKIARQKASFFLCLRRLRRRAIPTGLYCNRV